MAFYKLLLNDKLLQHRRNRAIDLEKIEGIKFYSKGKVGYFSYVDIDNISSFNPQNAIMGVYNCNEKSIDIQYISKNPQKGIFLWKEQVYHFSKEGDTITAFVKENRDTVQYVKIPVKNYPSNYNPDW